jgi:hypothetical protein
MVMKEDDEDPSLYWKVGSAKHVDVDEKDLPLV